VGVTAPKTMKVLPQSKKGTQKVPSGIRKNDLTQCILGCHWRHQWCVDVLWSKEG